MLRPVEEVAASQAKMIERLGTDGAKLEIQQIEEQLTQHRDQTLRQLRAAKNVTILPVNFRALINDPVPVTQRVVEFLGEERLPAADCMAGVVKPELYRQRGTNGD
jgi:hypothetical protein